MELSPDVDPQNATSRDFILPEEKLRNAITDRTKMILYNSPHNPTGKVFSREEIAMICRIVVEHNLLLVSDEVYERMTLSPDYPHLRPHTFPGMRDRTITIGSAGKSFSVTGWRVGWVWHDSSFYLASLRRNNFVYPGF